MWNSQVKLLKLRFYIFYYPDEKPVAKRSPVRFALFIPVRSKRMVNGAVVQFFQTGPHIFVINGLPSR